ncbi:MAG: rhomboid family intramembrane serine protease [Chitinophagaceae bacterium]|nr:rhomboid family intramembrane serine protease [Chitinophagaceae bacterium]
MAAGLPPKHTEKFVQEHLQQHQFLMLSLYAAQDLGWDVQYLSNAGIIAFTQNGQLKFNAHVKVIISGNEATLVSSSAGNEYFDLGKNKKTIAQFKEKFEDLQHQLSHYTLDMRYEEMRESILPDSQDILRNPDPGSLEIFKDFLAIFIPRENYFFTPIILNLNLLVFILMVAKGVHLMTPDADSLIRWGANYKPLTLAGEWWRLLTCCFIHIGVLHLLMNMYAFLYIGVLIEPILGKTRFIAAYLGTGIIASITSLWWHQLSVSAGASGAIFGMYGVFLALLTTSVVEKSTRKPLFFSIAIFVVYNLMSGIKEGVDNAAHIGGIVSGIFFGYLFLPSLKKSESPIMKGATVILTIIITLLLTFFALKKIPNTIAQYDTTMNALYTNDTIALSVYRLADTIQKTEKLRAIREIAIQRCTQSLTGIATLEQADFPPHLVYRVKLFKKYFQLRLKSYEIYYKLIDEENETYESQLNGYYNQIDSINKIIEQHD